MSLSRVSYLESWGLVRAPLLPHHQNQDQESDVDSDSDDERYHDLPEESLSSSSQSTYSYCQINPYAGPDWNQPTHADDPTPSSPMSDGPRNDDDYLMQTTAAFEVGRTRRICQVCIAVIYCFLTAGIVFGFAALKPVLIREGVYRNLCSQDELFRDLEICYEQELRLNLMFTIAAAATNVCALPVGTILDTYGPRVCGIIGSACLALGALLFGFAARLPFDGYIPGYLFLSLGGPFIFISSFHLSNTFPTRSRLVLSLLTGAFDASSAVFLGFRLANEKTNGSFTSQRFFLVYLVVPLFVLAAQLIMPATSYKTAGELVQQAEACMTDEAYDRCAHRQDTVRKIRDLLGGHITWTIKTPCIQSPLHGQSALHQICTPWFTLLALFTTLQTLRINYFIATIHQQYTYLLPPLANKLSHTFNLLLPLSALLTPFTHLLTLHPLPLSLTLLLLLSTSTLSSILNCIPTPAAAYTTITLFTITRPFFYAAVADYARVFGFRTFGTVYGLLICVAGVGGFAQVPLDALTNLCAGDPRVGNLLLTALGGVCGVVFVGYVSWSRGVSMGEGDGDSDGEEREPLLRESFV